MSSPEIGFNALPKILRILFFPLALIAIAILCWSGWDLLHFPHDKLWMVLAGLALISVPFSVHIPSAGVIVFLGEAYLMAIAIMYGVSPCVIAAAVSALCVVLMIYKPLGISRNIFKIALNIAVAVCNAFLYGSAYHLPGPTTEMQDMIMRGSLMVLIAFLFSSIFAAIATHRGRGKGSIEEWVRIYPPLFLNSYLAAVVALMIAGLYRYNEFIPFAVAPILFLIWGWAKFYGKWLMKREQDQVAAS